MKDFMLTFWKDESGQDLAEYAILLGIITVAVITIILTIGGQISNIFENASDRLDEVPAS